jgi:CRP-like cAMP-binding protein
VVEEASMDRIRELKQAFMFKDVPDPVLEIVAGTAEELSVSAGATIMSAGDTPNALYVIRNGTVRALIEGGKAPPVMFGTGETIGVGPFIDGGPAGGTVIALERVDLFVIRSAKLADVLVRNPEAGYQLYRAIARSLAGRLRRAVGMIAFSRERDTQS